MQCYYMIQRGERYIVGRVEAPEHLLRSLESRSFSTIWLRSTQSLGVQEKSYLGRLMEMADEGEYGLALELSESEYSRIVQTLQKKAAQDAAEESSSPLPPLPNALSSVISTPRASQPLVAASTLLPLEPFDEAPPATPRLDAWPSERRRLAAEKTATERPRGGMPPQERGILLTGDRPFVITQGSPRRSLFGRWQSGELLRVQEESHGDLSFFVMDPQAWQMLLRLQESFAGFAEHTHTILCSPLDLMLSTLQQSALPSLKGRRGRFFLYQPRHLYQRLFGSWLPDEDAQEIELLLAEQIGAEEIFLCYGQPFQRQGERLRLGQMGLYRGEIGACWVIPTLQAKEAEVIEKLGRDGGLRCPQYAHDLGDLCEMRFYLRLLEDLGIEASLLREEIERILPFESLCRLLEVSSPVFDEADELEGF